MGFLAPLMLWGAAAAAIPIALHFFFRSRYRRVPWAAMKFLLQSIEQTSRRLRFQELLLLLLRVAVLVVLAVALARPIWTAAAGSAKSEAVDAVFLVDTSYSMGARDGPETRLARAQAAARAVLDQLPPYSTVQVVTCADRAELLGPAAASHLDEARDLVDHIELTHLATDLLPGVKESAAALRSGQSPNKELYVFSDMQKLGWDQQAQPLVEALKEVHEKAAIYLVRCDRKMPANVAIVDITPQSGVPRPGERVGFAVLVRNTGAEPVQNLTVSLTVDGDDKSRETQALAKIDPGETRAVTLTGKLGQAGLRVLTATIKSDALEADNRFDKVILVPEQVRILVVDGAPNEQEPAKAASFFLMHALLPIKDNDRVRWHIRPRLVSARAAVPAHLADSDLCILCNCALERGKDGAEALSPEFLDHLNTFVRQGHGLLIFAGDRVQPDSYNRLLGQQYKLLPLKLTGIHESPAETPLHLNRKSADLPAYFRFREDDYYKGLSQVEVWKCLDVEKQGTAVGWAPPTGPAVGGAHPSAVALRYSDEGPGHIGRPAVLTQRVEAGEVMLVTTAPYPGWKEGSTDPTWTDWPLRLGMYLPFVDLTVGHLMAGQTGGFNMVAGQGLHWHVAEKDAGRAFTLVSPRGDKTRLGLPEMVQGRPVLALTGLTQAGVYRIVAGRKANSTSDEEAKPQKEQNDPGQPLAVVPDLRESADLTTLTDQQLDERLGFPVHHVVAGADPGSFIGLERTGSEWTPWLLAAVLVLAGGEALLAWFCGRAW
jgi:hypothetical protein